MKSKLSLRFGLYPFLIVTLVASYLLCAPPNAQAYEEDAVLEGWVTDENGVAVSCAQVGLDPLPCDGWGSLYTDGSGYFYVPYAQSTSVCVTIHTQHPSVGGILTLDLVPTSYVTSVSLHEVTTCHIVLKKGGVIAGRVTDEGGRGIYSLVAVKGQGNVMGQEAEYNSRSDSEGYFSISGCPLSGHYDIRTYCDDPNAVLLPAYDTAEVAPGETATVHIVLPDAVISGKVTVGSNMPLKNVRVGLVADHFGPTDATVTDGEGRYALRVGIEGFYQVRIALEARPTVNDDAIFVVQHDDDTVWAGTDSIYVGRSGGEFTKDIDFGDASLEVADNVPAERLDDLAVMYYHVTQVLDFEKGELGVSPRLNPPIEVHGYVPDNPSTGDDESKIAWYSAGQVYIGEKQSEHGNFNEPMNREWHEMFHELMDDTMGIPPRHTVDATHTGDENHGGYANDCTGDSWVEGWAEFWSCALMRYEYQDAPGWQVYHWGNRYRTSLETNTTVWQDEEFAVAGLLVDLVDPVDAIDNDFVCLTNTELWQIVGRSGLQLEDMAQVYSAFVTRNVGQTDTDGDGIDDLDELFISHGFYADDGDFRYNGETVGLGGRPGRTNRPDCPGASIRILVADSQGSPVNTGTLLVDVVFPSPMDIYNYSYEVPLMGSNDQVGLYAAPDGYDARITIRVRNGGGGLSNELTMSNTEYWQAVRESTTGYAYEHTFVVDDGQTVPPKATDDGYSVTEDAALDVPAPGVLGNDTDADGDPLTAVLVAGTAHGELTLNADGSFTYTPTAGFFGTDIFTYRANNGTMDSNVATVIVRVCPPWDINQDLKVDYKDLAILGAHYGETASPPYPAWDINQDGKVDYKDLAMLGAHYGERY